MSQSLASSKKQIERLYLDRFRALWPAFPAGRVEETEEPDFLLHTEKAIIGIELTELHQEAAQGIQARQAGEAMRHRAVAAAQERFIVAGLPPAMVSVFFNQNVTITKADV